jgi:hypothetical protein
MRIVLAIGEIRNRPTLAIIFIIEKNLYKISEDLKFQQFNPIW